MIARLRTSAESNADPSASGDKAGEHDGPLTNECAPCPRERRRNPAAAVEDLEGAAAACARQPDLDFAGFAREARAQRLHIGFLRRPQEQKDFVRALPRRLQHGAFGGMQHMERRFEGRGDNLDVDADGIPGDGGGDDIVATGERQAKRCRRRCNARGAPRIAVEDDVVRRASRAPGDQLAGERGASRSKVMRGVAEAREPDVGATAGIVERLGERFDRAPPASAADGHGAAIRHAQHAVGDLAYAAASGEDRGMEPPVADRASEARSEPTVSRGGLWRGALESLPFQPGALIFGLAVGAAASQTGLTLAESIGQSAIVYAGASQMLTLQVWTPDWTLGALLAAVGVTAAINARFLLMSATFRPWIEGLDRRLVYLSLLFLTDASFAIGARHHAAGGRDHGPVIGANVPLYLGWVATTAIGYLAGALVARPERYGLDLVLPIVFATLTVPMVRRAKRYAPLMIAGLVAIIVSQFASGWFIVAGALAGALSAALIDEAA